MTGRRHSMMRAWSCAPGSSRCERDYIWEVLGICLPTWRGKSRSIGTGFVVVVPASIFRSRGARLAYAAVGGRLVQAPWLICMQEPSQGACIGRGTEAWIFRLLHIQPALLIGGQQNRIVVCLLLASTSTPLSPCLLSPPVSKLALLDESRRGSSKLSGKKACLGYKPGF